MTIREKLQSALEARGWKVSESTSRKYVTMAKEGCDTRIFLGKAGGMRKGVCPSRSTSMNTSKMLREWEEANACRLCGKTGFTPGCLGCDRSRVG